MRASSLELPLDLHQVIPLLNQQLEQPLDLRQVILLVNSELTGYESTINWSHSLQVSTFYFYLCPFKGPEGYCSTYAMRLCQLIEEV